ncbi:DUF3408 domain-containing protein [Elizabethkingia ursingii]|uniref:DUF3408 domain-containing protein n=1 Tax=Elizabethkingia ursingii TaxID=1756150 RepID=UPI0007514577|nr:DUF3408 domain-containing protein [Elizabethkingia ursingii]KUY29908.1 conjugal transfer protein TraB [Elizabethkingia ursingii]
MEKEKKQKDIPGINEEFMMNLMVDGVKKEGIQLPAGGEEEDPPIEEFKPKSKDKPLIKERSKTKRHTEENYGRRFLKTHSMIKRGDKSIYIRQEYHERLSRIVQVIGKDEIPLYAYLDNILEHHFEIFEKAITDDFNENFKPLF